VLSARGGGAISWGAFRRVRRAGALTLTMTFVLLEAVALAVTTFGLAFAFFALGGIRYTIKLRKIKPRCLEPRQCHCAPQQLVWVT